MSVDLLHAKPYWLVYFCDGDLYGDDYVYESCETEASFHVFETEEAAHEWAKEQVSEGYWEHCVIVRATSLGTFSKAAVFTPPPLAHPSNPIRAVLTSAANDDWIWKYERTSCEFH